MTAFYSQSLFGRVDPALQRLAERYQSELALEPVEATQIGDLSELPARPLQIEDVILREAGLEAVERLLSNRREQDR